MRGLLLALLCAALVAALAGCMPPVRRTTAGDPIYDDAPATPDGPGPKCVKGCRCGMSCISCKKTCRK